ncbi:MAG: Smr/MutS family protein [Nitrospiraceae bacterium]|nr:MAG: Smr/MutS family protein [Nitrospiraceae bacterium]
MNSKKNHSFDPSFYHPFKDLKKLIDKKKKKASPPVRGTSAPLSDEMMFDNAMKEVLEIKEFRKLPLNPKKRAMKYCTGKQQDTEAVAALEEIVNCKRPVRLSDTPEYIEWINKDYKDSIVTRLHKGHYAIQDCLDLHGVILEDAAFEVDLFFRESLKKGNKCIKIIHGRGLRSSKGPVLKDAVVKLLSKRYRKYIVAFVSARQCDGGLGALYVLLQ